MTDLNSYFYVDGVHDVLAAYINELVASTLKAKYRNVETISAKKTLIDADCPVQVLTASGAVQDVELPAESIDNHPFSLINAGPTYNLVVRNAAGAIKATIPPGKSQLVLPSGAGWYISGIYRETLAASRTYYVGYNLGAVTISIATPGVVTKTAHGLSNNAPVVFSILPNKKSITVTIASPGVVTWTGHGLSAGAPIVFSTTGALPTGITAGTTYYVIATGLTTDTFQFSASVGGAAVNTSGTQSGSHFGEQTGTLPTGITAGTVYYAKSVTASTFEISATPGGASIATSGSQAGTISAWTGNDSNDGLSSSISGAFLTMQKAWSTIAGLDLSVYAATISVATGLHTDALSITTSPVGTATVNITGNTTTPSNCFWSVAGTIVSASCACNVTISGFKFKTTGSGQAILTNYPSAHVTLGVVEFNSATGAAHIRIDSGKVKLNNNYAISGGAANHILVQLGGTLEAGATTVTITNNPNFTSTFIQVSSAIVSWFVPVFSGPATGQKYLVVLNGVLHTFAGVVMPGDVGGATATGGQID